MQTLLLYALKTMVYSAIFFGYYCFALRNNRFHYYNRFYLLLTVLLSLLLPFVHLQLWQWNSNNAQVIHLLKVTGTNEGEVVVSSNSSALNWTNVSLLFYCIIALGLLLAAIFSVVTIFRLKTKYRVEKIENINFINTDLEQSPFSFFNNLFWRNTLSLTDEAGKQMFKHELTHIEQKHSWDKLLMRAITALFWFNPLYWLAQKELSLIHEFIADEKAIENKSAEAFALMILQSQYSKSVFSPAQSFHYSPIKRRLIMLTTTKKLRFSYARRILVLPLFAASILLFSFRLKNEPAFNKGDSKVQLYSLGDNYGKLHDADLNVTDTKDEASDTTAPVAQSSAPSFPGGKEGWLKYLRKNIKSEVPTDHGAPFGKYTVVVSFLVDADGNVSDVKAVKDPGYGTAAEAVRIINEGPKWLPAIQNGKAVREC